MPEMQAEPLLIIILIFSSEFKTSVEFNYLTRFLQEKVLEEEAIVMNISYNGFSVILPRYGLEGFIELSKEDENAHQIRLKKLLESDADQIINVMRI